MDSTIKMNEHSAHPVGSVEWLLELQDLMRDHMARIRALETDVKALTALLDDKRWATPLQSHAAEGITRQ